MYEIPLGKKIIHYTKPIGFKITRANPKPIPSIKNLERCLKTALKNPINSKKISDLSLESKSVAIVVTDITRSSPDRVILPIVLKEIEKGLDKKNIVIFIASGMHRKMSKVEKVEKFGKKIVADYKIFDHNAKDEKSLTFLGHSQMGIPIKISKKVMSAELLISIGVVEPHQFAGYSGGFKTVSIGLAGDETISRIHSHKFLADPQTRLGKVKGNPVQKTITEIGKMLGLDFIINVLVGKNNSILSIKAGEPFSTYNSLVNQANKYYQVPIQKKYDAVICGLGYPQDTNLYQASRAATYLFYAPARVIKRGGYIIIPAKCNEGPGKGIGEQRFFSMLKKNKIEQIISSKKTMKAGEQRAFFIANVLKFCKIMIVGSENPQIIKDAKMIAVENIDKSFEIIRKDLGQKLDVLHLQSSLITIPINKKPNG